MSEHYHYTWALKDSSLYQGKPNEYKNISSSQTKTKI